MRGHVAGTSCSDQVPSTSEMKVIVRWTNFATEIQFISQESHSFFYFRAVTASYCVAPIGHHKFDNNNYLNQRNVAFPGCLWNVWFVYCVIFFTVERHQIYLFLQIAIFPPREIGILCFIYNSPARKLSASIKNHYR